MNEIETTEKEDQFHRLQFVKSEKLKRKRKRERFVWLAEKIEIVMEFNGRIHS